MNYLTFTAILMLGSITVQAGEPLVIAHRGASQAAPENTLEAFRLAWEQDADAIEADFHMTRDGHIVSIHDQTTKRVAGTNLVVRQSTLDELRKLDVGSWHGADYQGAIIPTLAEVFSTVPKNKKIYIEIKCGAEVVPALQEEIAKSGLQREQIVLISFKQEVISAFKAGMPEYTANWLCSFKKDKSGVITPSIETVLQSLQQAKADGLSTNHLIPASVLAGVREQGYDWHVYTIDDVAAARLARKQGARSITTNVPGVIKENLAESGVSANVYPAVTPEH